MSDAKPEPGPRPDAASYARLKKAVDDWDRATSEAQAASDEFLDMTIDLKFAVEALERSCRRYLHTTGRIRLKPLKARAMRLARIMDSYLVGVAD